MDLDRHSFISMKDQGNKIYTQYCKDEQLTVDVYVQHLTLALLYYKRAKKLAKTPIEKSSIRKNLAVVQLCIAKKLLQRKRLTAKTRAQKRKEAVVNPSAQDDPASSIYGMPVIEAWKAEKVIIMKRSMSAGYSGEDNPLFYKNNSEMLYGDAKSSVEKILAFLR